MIITITYSNKNTTKDIFFKNLYQVTYCWDVSKSIYIDALRTYFQFTLYKHIRAMSVSSEVFLHSFFWHCKHRFVPPFSAPTHSVPPTCHKCRNDHKYIKGLPLIRSHAHQSTTSDNKSNVLIEIHIVITLKSTYLIIFV